MTSLSDKLSEILSLDLDEEEKKILQRMIENLLYYKRIIPRSIEKDLHLCIDIMLKEKKILDKYKAKCTCNIDFQDENSEN